MINEINPDYVPRRQTCNSAGYDIYAVEDMTIEPWFKTFDTGVRFDGFEQPLVTLSLPTDFWHSYNCATWVALIVPRSSMGFKHGLRFHNTMAIIDSDYRDTIKLSLAADHGFNIKKGERYAQILFIPHAILADEIVPQKQREGGVGSTGGN